MKILQFLRDNAQREKQPVNLVLNGTEASLYIYDAIFGDGWGVGAMDVVTALNGAKGASILHVHIKSPGGDVFEGRAIMTALRDFPGKKIAHIDSLCASAATSIALACDEVEMIDGAFFMIHNAMGGAFGDKREIRDAADTIEKIEGSIVADYVAKTGKDESQVRAWMDAESWFSAAEAKEHGFVDRVSDAPVKKSAKNTWNLAAFSKPPKALTDPPTPAEPKQQEEPAPAGFFMSIANANRLRLLVA